MKRLALALASLLLTCACAAGEEPSLTNEKSVFTGNPPLWKRPNQFCLWSARLSPDGQRVLYPRLQGEPPVTDGRPDWGRVMSEAVLRDLDKGQETLLPIGPMDQGWQTVHTRFNPFDPAGKKMALVDVKKQETKVDNGATAVSTTMKLVLYDVTAGKTLPGSIAGGMMLARFNRAGDGLIGFRGSKDGYELFTASLPGLEANALPVKGMVQSVCPTADVICVWSPPARVPPAVAGERPTKGPQRLFLYDLKARKEIADLPIDQRNSKLDDYETQWTPDGRFLYYTDVEDDPGAAGGNARGKTRGVSRVWDRQAGKSVTNIPMTLPVGPGPTPSSMVLARYSEKGEEAGCLLHDAATGTISGLGDASLKLVHAWGAKVLYVRTAGDKKEALYVADIVNVRPTTRPAAK